MFCKYFISVYGFTYIFFNKFYLFIYLLLFFFWLCWVFVSVRGLSLVAASGGHSSSWCMGLSLLQPLLLWSTGSRCAGSVVVAHGPSCSAACGIFQDQGSNPCPLPWQADSQPLRHRGSPYLHFFNSIFQRTDILNFDEVQFINLFLLCIFILCIMFHVSQLRNFCLTKVTTIFFYVYF